MVGIKVNFGLPAISNSSSRPKLMTMVNRRRLFFFAYEKEEAEEVLVLQIEGVILRRYEGRRLKSCALVGRSIGRFGRYLAVVAVFGVYLSKEQRLFRLLCLLVFSGLTLVV